jgi:hypothetical protein
VGRHDHGGSGWGNDLSGGTLSNHGTPFLVNAPLFFNHVTKLSRLAWWKREEWEKRGLSSFKSGAVFAKDERSVPFIFRACSDYVFPRVEYFDFLLTVAEVGRVWDVESTVVFSGICVAGNRSGLQDLSDAT